MINMFSKFIDTDCIFWKILNNFSLFFFKIFYSFLNTFDYMQKFQYTPHHFFQLLNLLNKRRTKFDTADNPIDDLLALLPLVEFVVQYRIPPVEGARK